MPSEEPAFGVGGFTGASDAGGYGLGRTSPSVPGRGSSGPAGSGYGSSEQPLGAPTYGSSSEQPTGFFGGRAGDSGGSGGYGGGGGGGGGRRSSGGHASGGNRKRRSLSALIGPMAGAIGLALLLGVGVYAFAESGSGCSGDDALKLNVSAAPDIEPAVTKAAKRFNDARHKVGGKCARAVVAKAEPSSVTTVLSGQGVTAGGATRPDVWVPDSSLWPSIVRNAPKGKDAVRFTKTSVASSPVVVGVPRTLSAKLKKQGVTSRPSWDNLLRIGGGSSTGGVTKNQLIPPGAARLLVPDPSRTASGMSALMIANALLDNDPNKAARFTGIVRAVRESTQPTVQAQYGQFRKGRVGKQPVALSSEQALWQYNRGNPEEPAVALYPIEGTLAQDYPVTITTNDGDKGRAAGLLEKAFNTEAARNDVRDLGFRTSDGRAPGGFDAKFGVDPETPKQLPNPKATDVAKIMQSWSRLSLGLRLVTLIDVSGSMAEKVSPTATRLQATAQVAQGGLSMMSPDTELGLWLFSTNMDGQKDYRPVVPVGALGERIGSITRRSMVLSQLNRMRPKPDGNTGLYDSVLAAYAEMKRTYKPEFGNSVLLLTDGANDDTNGPTLKQTVAKLKNESDPNRPIQINMIGFGKGVNPEELRQIATATNGVVEIAQTPQEVTAIFLRMLSRRLSN
ncbi:substrate-binding domain-containing protein [Spirillospora sp. CA-294931]|uniref:substrate-binding domain-containing protein n=1 Tax=Spirillospora sp. CA-294931 TaxID=3240042 RepID=UPI003D922A1B